MGGPASTVRRCQYPSGVSTTNLAIDEAFMRRAIELAAPHHPHPNPRVGCVAVVAGAIVGEGAHEFDGADHAERSALQAAGRHWQPAPISMSRSSRVATWVERRPAPRHSSPQGSEESIVATLDPDHRVAGAGVAALTAAGVEVAVGMLEQEAIELDFGYHHHRRTGRPAVHVVLTQSVERGLSSAANADLDALRSRIDYVVGGEGDLLHHPAAHHVSLRDQLSALGAEGIVDLGVRDDPALIAALAG